jgi:hypothetical protein
VINICKYLIIQYHWGCGGSVDIARASKPRLPTQQSRDRIRQPSQSPERGKEIDCVTKTNLGLVGVPTVVKKILKRSNQTNKYLEEEERLHKL